MRKLFSVVLIAVIALAGSTSSVIAFGAPSAAQAQELGKVTGILKDTAGKPIVNATVNITDKAGNLIATAVTDANGVFSAATPAGSYSISAVSATGAALPGTAAVTVAVGATTTVTVTAGVAGLAAATGSAGFIAALSSTAGLTALAAATAAAIYGVVQATEDASPSR